MDQIDLRGTLHEATRRIVAQVERRKIARAIKESGGDRGRAADQLQIPFKALMVKLKEYAME